MTHHHPISNIFHCKPPPHPPPLEPKNSNRTHTLALNSSFCFIFLCSFCLRYPSCLLRINHFTFPSLEQMYKSPQRHGFLNLLSKNLYFKTNGPLSSFSFPGLLFICAQFRTFFTNLSVLDTYVTNLLHYSNLLVTPAPFPLKKRSRTFTTTMTK